MAKSRKLEETLALLTAVRTDPTSEEAIATLHQVLKSKFAIAVSQAAKIIGDAELYDLMPALGEAFDRLMVNPAETDQGCQAKFRIAKALYQLNYSNEDLFLRGIRHVQMEAVWKDKQDTAASLRGVCALGLVRMNYPHVWSELADLLADPETDARVAAARAITYTNDDRGVPLLRLRVQVGDQPPVISECLLGLLTLAPGRSLSLVTRQLYARKSSPLREDTEIAEVAAMALGESRLPEAFPILQTWWHQVKDAELRQTGLLAIAMLRQDEPLDFLLSLVTSRRIQDAKDAIAALSLYRQDQDLWQRVNEAINQREDASLLNHREF
ncbi:HEAT repeat domain-containing protein [Phormidesmis sp. 146-12]